VKDLFLWLYKGSGGPVHSPEICSARLVISFRLSGISLIYPQAILLELGTLPSLKPLGRIRV
jgi:hypothetical protein